MSLEQISVEELLYGTYEHDCAGKELVRRCDEAHPQCAETLAALVSHAQQVEHISYDYDRYQRSLSVLRTLKTQAGLTALAEVMLIRLPWEQFSGANPMFSFHETAKELPEAAVNALRHLAMGAHHLVIRVNSLHILKLLANRCEHPAQGAAEQVVAEICERSQLLQKLGEELCPVNGDIRYENLYGRLQNYLEAADNLADRALMLCAANSTFMWNYEDGERYHAFARAWLEFTRYGHNDLLTIGLDIVPELANVVLQWRSPNPDTKEVLVRMRADPEMTYTEEIEEALRSFA